MGADKCSGLCICAINVKDNNLSGFTVATYIIRDLLYMSM